MAALTMLVQIEPETGTTMNPDTVPFVVDGCSINGAAGLVVPAALRRTVLRFAVCG